MYNYNPRGSRPPYGGNAFSSRYQFQVLPYGYEGTQTSGLLSKVMGLLAVSFIFAAIGSFVGSLFLLSGGLYLLTAIAGFVVLIALQFLIEKQGVNLFLLYLFTFLEGMSLGPLIRAYLNTDWGSIILLQAFLITAITSLALGFYAWTTKRDFTRIGDYLFLGLILLLVAGLVGIFFHSTFFALVVSVLGVVIFSGYVLYSVQQARYMADTLPNAIGITVSLFLSLINLFLYILRLLTILQGGGDERRS
ncbi:MAG: Bax inhibitor-1/YccA family protein [Ktedonobacteraceae bacterium]|nr:Bax inhibitor-1/YccA family protein [Ktedonobacteraceae bacterium]